MGVMEGLSAWPDTVAYKRLLRGLVRAQEYVPPQQPTGTDYVGPESAGESGAMDSSATAMAQPDQVPVAGTIRIGPWVLDTNEHGDLITRHDSGAVTVIATAPEGSQRG